MPGLSQPQLSPGSPEEEDQREEGKDKMHVVCYTPGKATRMYIDSSADGLRVTVAQAYLDGPVLQWRSMYETTPERKCPQVKHESTAHHIGMISSNGYLRGLKLHAMVAFKPLIFSSNLMRIAGYEISF